MTPKLIARSLARMVKRPFRRRPRIIMTLLCRDEEDIIGYNIAFHLDQGVDFVIVTDNASRDRTPLLLERFERQGRVHLIREPSLTHDQGVWVTRMARMAATRFDADWVINSDADEFWLPRTGTLRDVLAAMPRVVESPAVPTLDMVPPRGRGARFFEEMVIHLTGERTIHGVHADAKACHRAYADVRVAHGNHHVKRRGVLMPAHTEHPLQILHFPLRSPAQLERKIRQGAEALRANPRLSPGITTHWRRVYRDYFLPGKLGEYYDGLAFPAERIAAGLADGTLAEDTRIRDALRRIDPALAAAD